MTLLSLFALVFPAALVAPKATKREAQLAEQWEREIQLNRRLQTAGQTARLEALETEYAASGARGEAWRQAELDASEPEQLQHAFELAGGCTAIVTNTPHNTKEASAVVENLIALVEEQRVELVAALFRSIWGAEPGRLCISTGRHFTAKSFAVGVLGGSLGAKEARCMPTHGTSGVGRQGADHL